MTKCYRAYCEPFFSAECTKKSKRHSDRLIAERKKMVELGIAFDKTPLDEEKFETFMSRKAHVAYAKGVNEWYTPPYIVEAARGTMGSINVDPASSVKANEWVKADTYYTKDDDGLTKLWNGNVWMNPPYSQPLVTKFCDMFIKKYNAGEIEQGCVILNNATETKFLQNMLNHAKAICHIKGRVRFLQPDGTEKKSSPLQGQIMLYFGNNTQRFGEMFRDIGVVFYEG